MVGEGMVEWKSIVRNFYPDLHEAVEAANRELESVKIEDQLSDEFCELCGRQMVIKYGPHGKFWRVRDFLTVEIQSHILKRLA